MGVLVNYCDKRYIIDIYDISVKKSYLDKKNFDLVIQITKKVLAHFYFRKLINYYKSLIPEEEQSKTNNNNNLDHKEIQEEEIKNEEEKDDNLEKKRK